MTGEGTLVICRTPSFRLGKEAMRERLEVVAWFDWIEAPDNELRSGEQG